MVVLDISLDGLKGGHSGIEIDKQPASASYLLGRVLRELYSKKEFYLIDIAGGEFDNVICEHAKASIAVSKADMSFASEYIKKYDGILRSEYSFVNPDAKLSASVKEIKLVKVLDKDSTLKVLNAISLSFQGVIEMNMEVNGMVQTSQNIGIVKIENNEFKISYLVRSTIDSQKESAIARIRSLVELFGGSLSLCGNYPGWKYKPDSPLREACVKAYKECYGKEPVIDIIHAGLECGLFVDKLEGLDAISFGPNILDIHTPNERLDIASVERVWKMLINILENFK